MDAGNAFVFDAMRTHLVEQAEMGAFVDEKIVQRPQHRAERESVGHPPFVRAGLAAILDGLGLARHRAFEQAAPVHAFERAELASLQRTGGHFVRAGQEGAGERAFRALMHSQ